MPRSRKLFYSLREQRRSARVSKALLRGTRAGPSQHCGVRLISVIIHPPFRPTSLQARKALSVNTPTRGVDVISSAVRSSTSTHPDQCCYLTTRMGAQFGLIFSLQQSLSSHPLHRWHRPSAIPFLRIPCARHLAPECFPTRTKKLSRQFGKRNSHRRHRRGILSTSLRLMTCPMPMCPLSTPTRQLLDMLLGRLMQKRATIPY